MMFQPCFLAVETKERISGLVTMVGGTTRGGETPTPIDSTEVFSVSLWVVRSPSHLATAAEILSPGQLYVTNRSTPDSIALVEIKDDGVTGRL
jgi:hypothetical protein